MHDERNIAGLQPNELLSTASPADQSASPPPDDSGRRASLLNWLARLFFRPKKFFEENARSTSTFTVVFCVFVFGLAWSLTYYMDARKSPQLIYGPDVAHLYGKAVGLAALGGAFWYYVWGAWYGLRLSFCKPQGMTRKLYRRTFMFSVLVYSLPCAIGMSIWWIIQDQYFLLVALVVSMICIFWSVYVSYRGVRTVFQAMRARAVVLFIVLPCIFYGACFAAPIVAGWSVAERNVRFEHSHFTMHRPANWVLLENSLSEATQFDIPHGGSFVVVVLGTEVDTELDMIDLEEIAEDTVSELGTKFGTGVRKLSRFSEWGSYSGYGLRVAMNIGGDEIILRFFCSQPPDSSVLMVQEIFPDKAEAKLQTQFEVVRKTLKLKARD